MTLDLGRVQAIFLAALEQPSRAARAALLDRECAADDELRRRVEALLHAHAQPDRLLDQPLVVAVAVEPADPPRPGADRRLDGPSPGPENASFPEDQHP